MSSIKKPVITEKMSSLQEKLNRYGFVVDDKANKVEIKKDIENVVLKDEDDHTEMVDESSNKLSAQAVLHMITELPPGYRTVLSMYALDGFSHKEIAKKLGISEGTSKSQLAKARRMLKSRIEEGDE